MAKHSSRLVSLGVSVTCLLACVASDSYCDEFEIVRERIRHYVDTDGIPSISVAAIRGSDVVWIESFGWSDVENRVTATPHTAYMLASTSKPISATAVMIAAEKGHLKLDERMNQYLEASPFQTHLGDASRITVRDVLMHRSGLPNHSEAYFLDEKYRPPNREKLIGEYGWTMIPHGEFHYSNLAFSALADVIERTTGEQFSAYVDKAVFNPLGMDDSYVPDPGAPQRAGAVRYGEHDRLRNFSTGMVPAAEICSSAHDLARFALFHLNGKLDGAEPVLSMRGLAEMRNCTIPIRFFHYRYGLGWSVGHDQKGRRHVFHGGGFAGSDSFLTLLPEENVAVVFLSNKNRRWPGTAVSQDILERTLAILVNEEPASLRIDYDRRQPDASDKTAKEFYGNWRGTLSVGNRPLRLLLQLHPNGDAEAILNDGPATKIDNAEYVENAFFGVMKVSLQTSASRLPEQERLMWDLRLLNDCLSGVLYINAPSEGNGYVLPNWVTLSRTKARE